MKYALLLAVAALPLAADVNSTVYIPQVADGGYWQTTFTIVNLAPLVQAQGTIHLWAEDGTPLTLPFADGAKSQVDVTVPPNGVVTVETAGGSSPIPTVCWADFEAKTSGIIAVSALMRQRVPGRADYEVFVPSRKAATTNQVFYFDQRGVATATGTIFPNTGFGMVNSSLLADGTVNVTIRDDSGKMIDTFSVTLLRRTHMSFSLFDTRKVTQNVRGTVEFASQPGGWFSVIGLRFNPTGPITALDAMSPTP